MGLGVGEPWQQGVCCSGMGTTIRGLLAGPTVRFQSQGQRKPRLLVGREFWM